jgi:hypothetical protein
MSTENNVRIESLKRAIDAHRTVYLTLTSIVQGAVVAYLLSFVSLHHSEIGPTGWILTSATFLLVILTWNEYVMGVITFRWVPDIIDSCIPFMLGASQYLLVNAISNDPTKWVFRQIAFSGVSFFAFLNMYSKAKREDGHNAVVLTALGRFVPLNLALPAIGVFLSLVYVGITTLIGSCTAFTVGATGVVVMSSCAYVIRTWLYWRQFVTFARGAHQQLELPLLSVPALRREDADLLNPENISDKSAS